MDIAQLLDALGLAPDIEIVIARLPEGSAFDRTKFARCVLLEHLKRDGEPATLRFADQEVNMFGHNYEAANKESVPAAGAFEHLQEYVTCGRFA